MGKFTTNACGAMLLPNSIQVTESISGSVVPLAMFFKKVLLEKYSNIIFGWHLLNLTKCGPLFEYSIWVVSVHDICQVFGYDIWTEFNYDILPVYGYNIWPVF